MSYKVYASPHKGLRVNIDAPQMGGAKGRYAQFANGLYGTDDAKVQEKIEDSKSFKNGKVTIVEVRPDPKDAQKVAVPAPAPPAEPVAEPPAPATPAKPVPQSPIGAKRK